MPGRPFPRVRFTLAVSVLTSVVAAFSSAEAQNIKTLPQGEQEAHFNNGCIVFYDSRGNRTHYQGCSNDQLRKADKAIAQQGGQGHAGEPPRIVMGGNGEGEVIFRDNNCVVYYKRNGERDRANSSCDRSQRQQADDAMKRYRREQGLDGGNPQHSGDEPPRIVMLGSGEGQVIFRNNNCVVSYKRNGERDNATSTCNQGQREQADDAMKRYRREQGLN
jgi:hypothetical protein